MSETGAAQSYGKIIPIGTIKHVYRARGIILNTSLAAIQQYTYLQITLVSRVRSPIWSKDDYTASQIPKSAILVT